MNIEIANRLVQLRKQHGLSQEELAAKLGLSRQAVSKWERAEASPDTDNLILLSRVYGVSVDELLRTEDPIPEPEPEKGVKVTVNGKPIKFNTKDGFYFTYGDDEDECEGEKDDCDNCCYDNDGKGVHIHMETDKHTDHEKSFWQMFPYPVFIALAYFVMGIVWKLWHPAWILFITIPIYYSIAHWFKGSRRHTFWKAFPFPVFIVCLFLLLGCVWNLWYIAWVLFLTIPIYYPIVHWADKRYRRRKNIDGSPVIVIDPDDDDDDD
ncbi:MAG TPA: helix-turn-helix domain-containing protein [Clostridia bacterium]|nr:helix-turn-helix domain-containing protein [Clostridia bacterium]